MTIERNLRGTKRAVRIFLTGDQYSGMDKEKYRRELLMRIAYLAVIGAKLREQRDQKIPSRKR